VSLTLERPKIVANLTGLCGWPLTSSYPSEPANLPTAFSSELAKAESDQKAARKMGMKGGWQLEDYDLY
jgi:hypothetical protein